MSHFDYYLKHPERAVKFGKDGWQLTPMAENAIQLDAATRSANAEGDYKHKQEMRKGLEQAMRLRLKQAINEYVTVE